jgi:hypothetical protein
MELKFGHHPPRGNGLSAPVSWLGPKQSIRLKSRDSIIIRSQNTEVEKILGLFTVHCDPDLI